MSTLLPHLSDPWTFGYRSLSMSLDPIDDLLDRGVTPHNTGQTSNPTPTISHPRSVSSPPIPSMAGGKPSVPVASIPSNVGGKPPVQVMSSVSGVSTSFRQTSIARQFAMFVPPTNTNMVNPPSSCSQPLGVQLAVDQTSWGYGYPGNQLHVGNMNYQPTSIGTMYP